MRTMHGSTDKEAGNKPDFHYAMGGAEPFFNEFVELVRSEYRADRVQSTVGEV